MNSARCFSPLPATIRTVRLSWIVGCFLSCIGYGALLVIGYACYIGLRRRSSQGEGHPRVKRFLSIYVVFMLLLMTAVEILEIMGTVNSVLDDVCFFQNLQPSNPYLGTFAIHVWVINVTTDGLFIWRCYTACGGIRGQKDWFILLWVAPVVVYIIMLCIGFIVVDRLATFNPNLSVLVPILYCITGFLNVLITVCIIILILRYRRVATEALGRDLPVPNVMMVLVESAGLVVIIDTFVVACYFFGIWLDIAVQVWIPMQPMASFLIIHRVYQGSDYFQRRSEQISSLRFEQVSEPA